MLAVIAIELGGKGEVETKSEGTFVGVAPVIVGTAEPTALSVAVLPYWVKALPSALVIAVTGELPAPELVPEPALVVELDAAFITGFVLELTEVIDVDVAYWARTCAS